jgi:hypothetical protein
MSIILLLFPSFLFLFSFLFFLSPSYLTSPPIHSFLHPYPLSSLHHGQLTRAPSTLLLLASAADRTARRRPSPCGPATSARLARSPATYLSQRRSVPPRWAPAAPAGGLVCPRRRAVRPTSSAPAAGFHLPCASATIGVLYR